MTVNIDGMFLVARAIGKRMMSKAKGGTITQASSVYGALAPDHMAYEGSFYLVRSINTPAFSGSKLSY